MKWDEIVEIYPVVSVLKKRKDKYDFLVSSGRWKKRHHIGSISAAAANECLKTRLEPKRSDLKLTIMDVINIRLDAAAGKPYKYIRDARAPNIPIRFVKLIVWGELYEDWPGPIRTRRSRRSVLTKKERGTMDKIVDKLTSIDNDAFVKDLAGMTKDEQELIRYLRIGAIRLKNKATTG